MSRILPACYDRGCFWSAMREQMLAKAQRWLVRAGVTGALLLLLAALAALYPAFAAEETGAPALVGQGQLVVSGFSGTAVAPPTAEDIEAATRPAVRPEDVRINPDGATLRILDVAGSKPGRNANGRGAAESYAVTAREIGQVFGLALDDAKHRDGGPAPNIYAAASSAYGLPIVLPDASGNGTGRMQRIVRGEAAAAFMPGLFGEKGGPGTIWKIDGISGQASVLADLIVDGRPNSGPGLGALAFDPVSRQLFASDLETGLIHRLGLDGRIHGTFDHGTVARPVAGFAAIADDPVERADITSDAFSAEDPATWGYTHPARRVWGLAVAGRRLYYAVAEGPDVWSAAIGEDGSLGDARRELLLPDSIEPFEVSDIAFGTAGPNAGHMLLAQRPPVSGTQDFTTLVEPGPTRVLRYRPKAGGGWEPVPDEHPVGQKPVHRYTAGGLALGYGHKPEGGLDFALCEATLWTTGDVLAEGGRLPTRPDLQIVAVRGQGLAGQIDGLQGLDAGVMLPDVMLPDGTPPAGARYVDYDGFYSEQIGRGQLGVVRTPACVPGAAGERIAGRHIATWWQPATYDEARPGTRPAFDLKLEKTAVGACVRGGICRFNLRLTNTGAGWFAGPLLVHDQLAEAGAVLVGYGAAPWVCSQGGALVACHRPTVSLAPGAAMSLSLSFRLPVTWTPAAFANCAAVNWLGAASEADRVRTVQLELARLGYYGGTLDGIAGGETEAAIRAWQAEQDLAQTGIADAALMTGLFGEGAGRAGDASSSNDRDCARHLLAPAPAILPGLAGPAKPAIAPAAAPRIQPSLPVVSPLVPLPRSVSCPAGAIVRDGSCARVCAIGSSWIDGACRTACFGGLVRVGTSCTCPAGTSFDRGVWRCVRPEAACGGGTVKVDGACRCPAGSAWSQRLGTCVGHVATCAAGTHRRGEHCVKVCLPGLVLRDGECRPPVVTLLPPILGCHGGILRGGHCLPRHRDEQKDKPKDNKPKDKEKPKEKVRDHQPEAKPDPKLRRDAKVETKSKLETKPLPRLERKREAKIEPKVEKAVVRKLETKPRLESRRIEPKLEPRKLFTKPDKPAFKPNVVRSAPVRAMAARPVFTRPSTPSMRMPSFGGFGRRR